MRLDHLLSRETRRPAFSRVADPRSNLPGFQTRALFFSLSGPWGLDEPGRHRRPGSIHPPGLARLGSVSGSDGGRGELRTTARHLALDGFGSSC